MSKHPVDDCGFDARGHHVLDFGPRQFLAVVTPEGKVNVRPLIDGTPSEPGKTTLPAPRKTDDPDLAAAAKAALADMRRRLRTVTRDQGKEFLNAMGAQDRWNADEHADLILGHPVLRTILGGVVWSLHDSHDRLVGSFRYDEDDIAVDLDDETVSLDGFTIGVAHPVDLGAEQTETWQRVMGDYELQVPFRQLSYPVAALPPDQGEQLELAGLSSASCHPLKFRGVLEAWGWSFVGSQQAVMPWRWSNHTVLLDFTSDYSGDWVTRVVLLDGLHSSVPKGKLVLVPWSAAPRHLIHDVVSSTTAVG